MVTAIGIGLVGVGALIGSTFGPIGAAVGAVIGLILGFIFDLFGDDPVVTVRAGHSSRPAVLPRVRRGHRGSEPASAGRRSDVDENRSGGTPTVFGVRQKWMDHETAFEADGAFYHHRHTVFHGRGRPGCTARTGTCGTTSTSPVRSHRSACTGHNSCEHYSTGNPCQIAGVIIQVPVGRSADRRPGLRSDRPSQQRGRDRQAGPDAGARRCDRLRPTC